MCDINNYEREHFGLKVSFLSVSWATRSCTLLTCTTKGKASMRRVENFGTHEGPIFFAAPETWNVCGSGEICCSKVNFDEGYSVFGG